MSVCKATEAEGLQHQLATNFKNMKLENGRVVLDEGPAAAVAAGAAAAAVAAAVAAAAELPHQMPQHLQQHVQLLQLLVA